MSYARITLLLVALAVVAALVAQSTAAVLD
jgi:hypothetical protein